MILICYIDLLFLKNNGDLFNIGFICIHNDFKLLYRLLLKNNEDLFNFIIH